MLGGLFTASLEFHKEHCYPFTLEGEYASNSALPAIDGVRPVAGFPEDAFSEDATVRIELPGDTGTAVTVSRDELASLISSGKEKLDVVRIQDQPAMPDLARTFMRLRNRSMFQFSPVNGDRIRYIADGRFGYDDDGHEVFPRLDPAVIGLVTMGDEVLLTRKPGRQYYSLVAGYVEPGEPIEAAFAREVLEETGRRVAGSRYVTSAPWAATGSLMLGMRAETTDREAQAPTDGELEETRWASREDILSGSIPLTGRGSLARTLIDWWCGRGEL